jgi:putative ABC transport system permease protein
MITRSIAFVRGLLRRRAIDDEIAEELRDHLEREIEMHVSRGVSPDEARRRAIRDLGGLTQTIEATRAVRATWFDGLGRDARYAARVLRRSPLFTATALALLVLGIGATTAILSVAYAVLVRPLPFPNADRLVFITEKDGAGVAWPNFEDWRLRAKSFDGLAGSLADAVLMTTRDVPRRFESRSVTSNFFRVLGVVALRGRLFDASDARPDATPTAVVSHAFWLRELGGNTAAIGQTIPFNGKSFHVIGVLPPSFRFMTPAEVYLLIEPQVAADYRGMQSRTTHTTFYVVGRLKAGVSVTGARTEMQTLQTALAGDSTSAKDVGIQLVTLADRIVGDMAATLTVLAGAVALLLLITCANLAALLLNRNAARAHEFTIRAAIGGNRWQLIRQLLVEHAMLIAAGAALGAVAGAFILYGLVGAAPRDLPRLDEIRLDFTVMSGITAVSCACAFMFGVVPTLRTFGGTGAGLATRSGRGTRSRSSLRTALMIGEIALATVLLSGSGLMIQTMRRLSRVDPGFDPHNLKTVMFSLQGAAWPDARKEVFYRSVVERLRAVPGVEDAAITYSLPMLGSNWWNVFMTQGTTAEYWTSVGEFPNAGMVPVTAGYFEMLRIPLLKGRYFNRSDTPTSLPVAIMSSSAARKYWPNEDPIGKQVRQGYPNDPYGPWRTIVGVVGDIKQNGIDQEMPRQVFLPIVQQPRTTVFAIARLRAPVPGSSIEAAIHDLDRTIPVFNDRTIDQVMTEASSRRRVAMLVLSVFGGVALFLAAIGLYGVVAQSVADRHHEIGVRMALGATSRQVVRLFLRHGLVVIAIGVPAGLLGATVAVRSLASLVYGITVTDPATLGAVALVLVAVTAVASFLPSRSAARTDPLTILRAE